MFLNKTPIPALRSRPSVLETNPPGVFRDSSRTPSGSSLLSLDFETRVKRFQSQLVSQKIPGSSMFPMFPRLCICFAWFWTQLLEPCRLLLNPIKVL